jgi:multiple sugar transport system permease protein
LIAAARGEQRRSPARCLLGLSDDILRLVDVQLRDDGTTAAQAMAVASRQAGRKAGSWHRRRAEARGAAILAGPYVVVLVLVGLVPAVYAIYQSLSSSTGTGFAGLANFRLVVSNFQFWPAFEHVGLVILIWIPLMLIGVIGLALLIDATRGRLGRTMMFIYYIPGALAGMANFMLWLLLLDPTVSPIKFLLHAAGAHTLDDVLSTTPDVALILAAMLFFQGAGSWLVIIYGGLNSIPEELNEAARLDGCSAWKLAIHVKLPIIRPWIAYLALANFAYAFQIFLEPQVLSQAAHGLISPQWSPNQLSYTYAFQIGNIPAAAALSVIMLLVTLAIGVTIVTKTGVFEKS